MNTRNKNVTPNEQLLAAVKKGDIDVVLLLLEQGVDVNYCTQYSELALIAAILDSEKHALDIIKLLLLYNADVNQVNERGCAPLHAAITKRDIDIVNVLLEAQANVNQRDHNHRLPLEAVISAGQFSLLELMLQYQVDLSAKTSTGDTLLIYAMKNGMRGCAEALVNAGADTSVTDHDGNTPLHLAIKAEEKVLAKLLLSKASPALLSHVNRYGHTVLYIAAAVIESVRMVKMLLTAGAPDLPNTQGITAEVASSNNTIRLLLSERRKANQLSSRLFAFEEAQEAALSMTYASPEEAKKAMRHLAHMTMLSIEHNLHFVTQNRDRLLINYQHDLVHLIAQLSTLLTILNQDDMPASARDDVDRVAACVRSIAAKLGDVSAKKITEHFPVPTSFFSTGLFQRAGDKTSEENVNVEKKDRTSTP